MAHLKVWHLLILQFDTQSLSPGADTLFQSGLFKIFRSLPFVYVYNIRINCIMDLVNCILLLELIYLNEFALVVNPSR